MLRPSSLAAGRHDRPDRAPIMHRIMPMKKDLEFGLANNGIVGFETALALGYHLPGPTGHLTLPELAGKP